MFVSCTKLETVLFEGVIKVPLVFESRNLTIESLQNIIDHLQDRTGLASLTIVIGTVNINKLSDEYLAIAANKNWILG